MKQPMDFEWEGLAALTREQLLSRVEAELAAVRNMQRARRWAPGYMRHFGIFPMGVHLIPWLTHSRCRCNAEALVEWIEAQLEDPTLTDGTGWMPQSIIVARRLESRLAAIKESCPW